MKSKHPAELKALREEVDKVSLDILELLIKRFQIVDKIFLEKIKSEETIFNPSREQESINLLIKASHGRIDEKIIKKVFKSIFESSLEHQENRERKELQVKRCHELSTFKELGLFQKFEVIAGPCSIESKEQLQETFSFLKQFPQITIARGGAFKPRTNPNSFQGLGTEALKLLKEEGTTSRFKVISEAKTIKQLALVAETCDIIQIGTRNMFNYDLLEEAGKINKPILLKRSFMATFEEYLLAAEYIAKAGNSNIIFCERGIRTFEKATRNTLDLSIVPLLKAETSLPVVVDVSHAAGRRDLIIPLAKAAKAIGADGVMVEVHPNPEVALSDRDQQLDFAKFSELMRELF